MRTSQAVIAMAFILLTRVEAFAFSSCVRGARPARCLSILQAIDQDGQAQAAVGKVEPTHFNGTTHSSSEFITHFIAGAQPGLTVESAVQSLLPRQDLAAGPQQHRDMLLKNEDDTLLAEADLVADRRLQRRRRNATRDNVAPQVAERIECLDAMREQRRLDALRGNECHVTAWLPSARLLERCAED